MNIKLYQCFNIRQLIANINAIAIPSWPFRVVGQTNITSGKNLRAVRAFNIARPTQKTRTLHIVRWISAETAYPTLFHHIIYDYGGIFD